MDMIEIREENVTIKLSKDELGTLASALNEICNGIEVWEFETRIGATVEEARLILESLSNIYFEMKRKNNY